MEGIATAWKRNVNQTRARQKTRTTVHGTGGQPVPVLYVPSDAFDAYAADEDEHPDALEDAASDANSAHGVETH